jgi:hypothetical protein
MKEFNKTVTTQYSWWNPLGDMNPEHRDELTNAAEHHIESMTGQGFTSGEFNHCIDDEAGLTEYLGWWSVYQDVLIKG